MSPHDQPEERLRVGLGGDDYLNIFGDGFNESNWAELTTYW